MYRTHNMKLIRSRARPRILCAIACAFPHYTWRGQAKLAPGYRKVRQESASKETWRRGLANSSFGSRLVHGVRATIALEAGTSNTTSGGSRTLSVNSLAGFRAKSARRNEQQGRRIGGDVSAPEQLRSVVKCSSPADPVCIVAVCNGI